MKTLTIPFTGLLLFFFISGCTSVKRFKSASYKGEDDTLVDMSLFGSHLEQAGGEPEKRNLWDLSAGAQTQLIQILNERYPENEQFTAALNMEYLADGPIMKSDFTRRDLKMVFTISRTMDYAALGSGKGRYSPADRIESVKYSLTIPPEYNLQFVGWNRHSTEYGEIEIADVSFSRSLDLSADIPTEYLEGGIKGSSGRKEDQSVRSRYIQLNGSISPLKLEMVAEGNREIDLAGNVVAEVTLVFKGFPERVTNPGFLNGNSGTPPVLATIGFRDVIVPRMKDIPDTLMAGLEMEYVYRHVESGWKSYQEWDDRVAFYSGKLKKQVAIFTKDQYLPMLYGLGTEGEGGEAMKIKPPGGQVYPLQFSDYHMALRFLEWLQERTMGEGRRDQSEPLKAVNCQLLLGERLVTPERLSSVNSLKVIPVY